MSKWNNQNAYNMCFCFQNNFELNTPGTRGWSRLRNRTLAIKSRKSAFFFVHKIKITYFFYFLYSYFENLGTVPKNTYWLVLTASLTIPVLIQASLFPPSMISCLLSTDHFLQGAGQVGVFHQLITVEM